MPDFHDDATASRFAMHNLGSFCIRECRENTFCITKCVRNHRHVRTLFTECLLLLIGMLVLRGFLR